MPYDAIKIKSCRWSWSSDFYLSAAVTLKMSEWGVNDVNDSRNQEWSTVSE
jgi:hypothetical protein